MMGDAIHIKRHGCDHIFFIGFMGAGKSTVARNLGKLFNRRYLDTDKITVRRARKSIREIFADEGEEGFRFRETATLESLSHERSCLISCGGGVIERPRNIELMREMGFVVYLEIDLDGAMSHIVSRRHRPTLGGREHNEALLAHRRPLYESAADLTVDIRGLSFQEITYVVGEKLWEAGRL